MTPDTPRRKVDVVILAIPGCSCSAVVGISDILSIANYVLAQGASGVCFSTRLASIDGREIPGGPGVRLAADTAMGAIRACDVVIVPGFLTYPVAVRAQVAKGAAAAGWLRRIHASGAVVAGFCSGVFALAEAGILDGRRATTTWWLQSQFKRSYPYVDLAFDEALTDSDNVICAAGPMSWIDLSLHLVERICGPEAARACADVAVIDRSRKSQLAHVPKGYLLKRDAWLTRAESLVRHAGSTPMDVGALANALKVPRRTLLRRIRLLSGESVHRFIERIRMESARTLLESTHQTVREIATAVGYQSESSFRRVFRKRLLTNPQAYRVQRLSRTR